MRPARAGCPAPVTGMGFQRRQALQAASPGLKSAGLLALALLDLGAVRARPGSPAAAAPTVVALAGVFLNDDLDSGKPRLARG
jgi:hypothetical protein